MPGYVRTLNIHDNADLANLRYQVFQSTPDFTGDHLLNDIHWTEADEHAIVLGVWDENAGLISTMRIHLLSQPSEIQKETDMWAEMPSLYPTAYLRKAATRAEFARFGFNSLIRYYILEAAIRGELKSLSGVITSHGARAQTLRDLGYEFRGGVLIDGRSKALSGNWKLVVLDLNLNGISALQKLFSSTAVLREQYPWCGESLVLSPSQLLVHI